MSYISSVHPHNIGVALKARAEYEVAVSSLDLGPIMAKLEYEGMDKNTIEELEVMYRNFLLLYATNPGMIIVPTKELDEFWHHHILDTQKYAEDCEKVFGFFLHHFPYYGMRSEEDEVDLQEKFQATADLYQHEFGQPYQLEGQTRSMCNGGVCGYVTSSWRPEYEYSA